MARNLRRAVLSASETGIRPALSGKITREHNVNPDFMGRIVRNLEDSHIRRRTVGKPHPARASPRKMLGNRSRCFFGLDARASSAPKHDRRHREIGFHTSLVNRSTHQLDIKRSAQPTVSAKIRPTRCRRVKHFSSATHARGTPLADNQLTLTADAPKIECSPWPSLF